MNKKNIISLVNSFIVAKNAISDIEAEINNVTTNLQNAFVNDLVFYKVNPLDENGCNNFKKRLETSSPGLLFLNHGAEFAKNENCLFVDENDFLKIQKLILDELFPNKKKLKIVGVTGTNGKTTTVNLGMQVSSLLGHPAISIGTIGVQDINGVLIKDIESTTPSYVELRKLIYQFQDKYEACFLEVSSHALAQERIFDIKLEGAAWTSFSQDHLDYHRTMDAYFNAKLLIERKYLDENQALIIPNLESELYELILKNAPKTKVKIAKTLEARGFDKTLEKRPLFFHSTYNQSNMELAFELNESLYGDSGIKNIHLKDIVAPHGRFSIIELLDNNMAIIDYAHTPDALKNIGNAIKNAFPNHSLTVVFGCGGNRDKMKRPMMGKTVAEFANKIIVTSDNPRDEAPEDIIIDILAGIKENYEAVVDREKAILSALDCIKKNEIILIAGKGHEEYQEIKGIKNPFSDFNIVKNYKAGK